MTRENKLALIVGFGLILLVGILVSDYFSESQRPEQAELSGVIDPLGDRKHSENLIQFKEASEGNDLRRRDYTPASHTGQTHGSGNRNGSSGNLIQTPEKPRADRNQQSTNDEIVIGGPGLREQRGNTDPVQSWRHHHVRSNETLTSICKQYYNTGDYKVVLQLAEFNSLDNPDSLREGRRLRIPASLSALQQAMANGDTADLAPVNERRRDSGTGNASLTRTYTVKDSDTLSEIASREMGSAKHWRALYEANKNVIRNPDRLIPGTVLQIPSA